MLIVASDPSFGRPLKTNWQLVDCKSFGSICRPASVAPGANFFGIRSPQATIQCLPPFCAAQMLPCAWRCGRGAHSTWTRQFTWQRFTWLSWVSVFLGDFSKLWPLGFCGKSTRNWGMGGGTLTKKAPHPWLRSGALCGALQRAGQPVADEPLASAMGVAQN